MTFRRSSSHEAACVSNMVNRFDEAAFTGTYIGLFDQIQN